MQAVDARTFGAALAAGATVLDLRPAPVPNDALPGARTVTLEDIQAGRLPELPKNRPVYLVCERGAISELAGLYLEDAGFSEVYNVLGGMQAWRRLQAEHAGQ